MSRGCDRIEGRAIVWGAAPVGAEIALCEEGELLPGALWGHLAGQHTMAIIISSKRPWQAVKVTIQHVERHIHVQEQLPQCVKISCCDWVAGTFEILQLLLKRWGRNSTWDRVFLKCSGSEPSFGTCSCAISSPFHLWRARISATSPLVEGDLSHQLCCLEHSSVPSQVPSQATRIHDAGSMQADRKRGCADRWRPAGAHCPVSRPAAC